MISAHNGYVSVEDHPLCVSIHNGNMFPSCGDVTYTASVVCRPPSAYVINSASKGESDNSENVHYTLQYTEFLND
jgi:hypothetical protein